jgi:hypothetical protein
MDFVFSNLQSWIVASVFLGFTSAGVAFASTAEKRGGGFIESIHREFFDLSSGEYRKSHCDRRGQAAPVFGAADLHLRLRSSNILEMNGSTYL